MSDSSKSKVVPNDTPEQESLESQSLTAEAKATLSEDDFKTLQKIAVHIGKDGMTLEEACVLANVEYDNLKAQALKFPVIEKVIRMKELEYKKMLMKNLSARARGGDDKVAQWLLESRYPDEFGGGKRKGDGGGDDLLGMAIDFIQTQGDKQTLVRKQVVLSSHKTPRTPDSDIKKLQAFLT